MADRQLRAGAKNGGKNGDRGGDDANEKAGDEERGVLAENEPLERWFAETDGEEEREFAAAFEYVAQKDDAETETAENQSEAAERGRCMKCRAGDGEVTSAKW